jgi:dephospho-CoA kinase
MHDQLVEDLTEIYFKSRPNLQNHRNPLSIFFLACSGAGKSTLRKKIIQATGATYVCNDEVRELLEQNPKAIEADVSLKEIVAKTWQKIMQESLNKMVVFDNNIIQYYMYEDSYINVSQQNNIPIYTVCIEVPAEKLKERIISRDIKTEQIMQELPGQLTDFKKAKEDISCDWALTEDISDEEIDKLIDDIKSSG